MILLVDDNRMTARVMEANLGRAGLKTQSVEDAEAALAALDASPEISVVVTDLSMPGMDGLAFMDAIRERPELSALPIIVASGTVDVETVKAVSLRGARRVFVKPIPEDELVHEIQSALKDCAPLTLVEEHRALKKLGLDSEQYFEILSELADSVRTLAPKLEALVDAEPEDGGAQAAVRAAVRNVAETVGTLARGDFMATIEHLEDAGRAPSASDWCRVALREVRRVSAMVEERLAEKAASDASPPDDDGGGGGQDGDGERADATPEGEAPAANADAPGEEDEALEAAG